MPLFVLSSSEQSILDLDGSVCQLYSSLCSVYAGQMSMWLCAHFHSVSMLCSVVMFSYCTALDGIG